MVDLSPFNPMKVLYFRNEIETLLRGEMVPPVFITIDPSNRCNQQCVWCFVKEYRKENAVDLSPDVMFKVIDQLKGKVKALAYCGGGEPLINPATIEAMVRANAAGIQQGLITNGSAWRTEEDCKIIAKTNSFVRVSIDAATPETYKKLHGVDLFPRVVQFLKHLLSARINGTPAINVSFMICPMNLDEVLKAAQFFKDLGVDGLVFKFVYSMYKGITPGFDTNDFLKKNHLKIEKLLESTKALEDKHFKVTYRHPGTFQETTIKHLSELYARCYLQPLSMAGIAANGDLYLCCDRRGDLILGNLNENGNFWDLWYSKKHIEIVNNINLRDCPYRCKITEMNQIAEHGFLHNDFDWFML